LTWCPKHVKWKVLMSNVKEDMITCSWQGTGEVNLFFTVHIQLNWNQFCTVGKPKLVIQCNKDMSGVDKSVQLSTNYSSVHNKNVQLCHLWYFMIATAL
jgi:hypothetical protein